uniref:Uncharacterized protein n=1 Tax=Trypanosoma vivax (strain Y486) TaxID=1055687 RepID=G0U1W5_TRYVY|nr:hypothetical protein TVY486_0900870 [Trypanosoma vivax Y486]
MCVRVRIYFLKDAVFFCYIALPGSTVFRGYFRCTLYYRTYDSVVHTLTLRVWQATPCCKFHKTMSTHLCAQILFEEPSSLSSLPLSVLSNPSPPHFFPSPPPPPFC